ncbi:hypothetical protein MMC16_002304 [Acarospora aff. strigata]|nr:hypothetical protein [Acarospora aff. strigata]
MIIDDPHRWTGDTPTPCASTSESSVSTLTVDDSIVLTKRGVGEAFESTYWSTIRESRGQDFEDDYEIRYEQEQGEKQDKEQPLENLDLVEVSLDDESGPRIECISPHQGITKHIRKWWGSNVSMVIPDDQELRDHFSLEKTYLAYFRTAMSLAMTSAMLSQFYIFSTPTVDPHPLDFRDVGKPLACSCLGIAVIVTIIGAARFQRAQNAMLNGKALIGGADLMLVAALISMLVVALMVTAILI